jgi:hypothetical protein
VFARRADEPAIDLASPSGDLYASDPAGKEHGTGVAGGPAGSSFGGDQHGHLATHQVSPDGKTLYVNESVQRNVWAFTIEADGSLTHKRL